MRSLFTRLFSIQKSHNDVVSASKVPAAHPIQDLARHRTSSHYCNPRPVRYRSARSISNKTVARWRQERLQQRSGRQSLRFRKLSPIYYAQTLESIVCLYYSSSLLRTLAIYLVRVLNITLLIQPNYSLTNFNLVISVLSMFFMLVKAPMFILNVFYPPISIFVHTSLIALYAISLAYQASPDMMDPDRPQPGAPWYLTKSCSVANSRSNVAYCQQAKASFACTVLMLYVTARSLG